jgi:hypothetical protein
VFVPSYLYHSLASCVGWERPFFRPPEGDGISITRERSRVVWLRALRGRRLADGEERNADETGYVVLSFAAAQHPFSLGSGTYTTPRRPRPTRRAEAGLAA